MAKVKMKDKQFAGGAMQMKSMRHVKRAKSRKGKR